MNHILQMDVEHIKNFIKTVPLGVVIEFKKECDSNPTHPKVVAVREELQKRVN